MKKLALLITLTLALIAFAAPAYAATTKIVIDGNTVNSSVSPVVINDTTMVPLRLVTENLGATVDYDSGRIDIQTPTGMEFSLLLNSDEVYSFQDLTSTWGTTLDVAPFSNKGTTMVPLRFIAENMNCTVDYQNGLINITSDSIKASDIKAEFADEDLVLGVKNNELLIYNKSSLNSGKYYVGYTQALADCQKVDGKYYFNAGNVDQCLYCYDPSNQSKPFSLVCTGLTYTWYMANDYIYYILDDDITNQYDPCKANLYRVKLENGVVKNKTPQRVGVEGFMYGYTIDYVDWENNGSYSLSTMNQNSLTIKDGYLYCNGVQKTADNTLDLTTYGQYKINLSDMTQTQEQKLTPRYIKYDQIDSYIGVTD